MAYRFKGSIIASATMAIWLVISPAYATAAPPCSQAVAIDERCEIGLDELHPTQPAVGLMQVEERVAKLKGETDFDKYTSKWPVPVVQAPDGTFYLTDAHHLTSVLVRLGAAKVNAQVIGRFDDPATFWQQMQTRQWVYLFDPHGDPIPPTALPKRLIDLADDPYRALAGYAGSAGYFKKSDMYFMEFYWARYFGKKMQWKPIDRQSLPDALRSARKLACLPEAKDLPGYAGPCPINVEYQN